MRLVPGIVLAVLVLTVGAIVLASDGGGDYELRITLENGSQLVKGNRITVGGRQVGLIDEIVLTDDNLAEVRASLHDDDLLPLHEGTTATVRIPSLASVANRYISLDPGPNSASELVSGARIPVAHTTSSVEVDAVLNTLDARTRGALRGIVEGGATQYDGVQPQANAALERLNPALAELEQTAYEVGASGTRMQRLLTSAAAVVSSLEDHRNDLQDAITQTAAVAGGLAGARGDLDSALTGAPAALRGATTALHRAARTARVVRPAARAAATAAPSAARLIRALRPTAQAAAAAAPALRGLARDLEPVLRGMPALARTGAPALRAAAGAFAGAEPILAAARAYTPDLIGGLLGGLGGSTSGYYDANGHYLRLGINASLLTPMGLASLLPTEALTDNPVLNNQDDVDARCPGAATQPAADRSNPWVTPEAPCSREDSP